MKILVGFGCSMVFGYPNNHNNSVMYQLSRILDMDYVNCAINAAGNDLIYEKILVEHYSGKITPDDSFIVIGWSEVFRRKIFYNQKVWETFRPIQTLSDDEFRKEDSKEIALYSDYFMNNNQNYYDTLSSIISTYHLLKSYGYNYLMFDALSIRPEDDLKIDKNWIPNEFLEVYNSIPNYYREIQYNEFLDELYKGDDKVPYVSEVDGHPNEYGATEFAKVLYDNINMQKI